MSDFSLLHEEDPGTIRVLHVDDNPQLGRVFCDFLVEKSDRIEAETVADPTAALERVLAGEVDCVVSDYDMPDTDGIELLEAVREEYPDLPFFLFTGQGSEEVASAAIAAGATGYLQKGRGTDQYAVLANRVENAVDQYRTQQAAERTERHVRELMENTPDVRWMFTGDWSELLFVNTSYEDIYGGSVAELEADPTSFLDTVHPEDREAVQAALDRLSDGEAVEIRYRVDPRTDYERWVEVRGRPIREDGEVRRVVGYSREVTERMRRQRELRETRRLLTESLDALDDVFCILDAESRVERHNDTLTDVLGVDSEEVDGRRAVEFFAEPDRQAVREAIEEAVETGTARVEARLVTADGERIPYEFTGARLDDDGTVRGVIAIGRDVSERLEYERTLEAQNERLEEFAGVVSHDLRNPLTAIRSQLELYRRTGEESHLDDVGATLGRMERLLEDLLQVARYGEAVEDPTPTSLDDVVDRAAVGTLPDGADLTVASVPPLYADSDRLQQLVANLLRNAAEHASEKDTSTTGASADGGAADLDLAVRVGPVSGDGTPDGFYVADDGPGIPAADREEVFETGYTTSEDGTGYGLSVVRSVAEAHGWTLSIADSWAGGARVEVRDVSFVDTTARVDADLDA